MWGGAWMRTARRGLGLVGLVACSAGSPPEPVADDTGAAEAEDADTSGGPADDGGTDGPADDEDSGLDGPEEPTWPALVVNEVVSDNDGSTLDPGGAALDWVELYNPTDGAVSLQGWGVSDDYTDPAPHRLPAGLEIPAGGFLVLWASGEASATGAYLPFGLSADGEGIGLRAPDDTLVDWVVVPPLPGDRAHARIPDGSGSFEEVAVGTPGATNRRLAWEALTLVPAGALWAYADDGVDLGTAWRDPAFDDSAWAQGPAPLGYGDSHIVTTVSYGPDPGDKHPTTYFRHTVDVPTVPTTASLELLVDDGAVVWVNGMEVYRTNLGSGDVTFGTYADGAVAGGAETAYTDVAIDASAFVVGPNVVAVEVHQATPGSSDQGFDLGVVGEGLVEVPGAPAVLPP